MSTFKCKYCNRTFYQKHLAKNHSCSGSNSGSLDMIVDAITLVAVVDSFSDSSSSDSFSSDSSSSSSDFGGGGSFDGGGSSGGW